ncbi:protein-disulfide isomerase [Palleronia aestuarii]|uniref:Protein-disulfide isomerase n=1 Tax=Palleronia aestuarii TaxID=568105 RepID=A0A2W7NI18_9RHOB|nr:DsbA family protein [Palleronia aestuarii]PZX12786.1 protein-disulfide isomerase [Palleronia aestuarii]
MHLSRRSLIGAAGAALALPSIVRAQDRQLTVEEVLYDTDAPVLANPEGDVTVVEFFDYQCPYCKRAHPMLMDVTARDPGVRLVLKDWPLFGAPSVRASQLALGAVELGAYGAVNEALMATEGRLSIETVEETVGSEVAAEAAMTSYRDARTKWDGLMSRNQMQAAAFGFQGTPSFVIGTTLFGGMIDRDTLDAAIREARKA